MGKLLANMEFFPEYTKFGGPSDKAPDVSIRELYKGASNAKTVVDNLVQKQLGIKVDESGIPTRVFEGLANVYAKSLLSSPTSGIKNTGLGIVGGTTAFDGFHTLTAYSDALRINSQRYNSLISTINKIGLGKSLSKNKITAEDYRRIVRTGATEIGMRHFKEGAWSEGFDRTFFRYGLMRPTEKLNRFAMVLAGWADQKRLVDNIRNQYVTKETRDFSNKRLKSFYELGDKDISLLKKYGFDGEKMITNDINLNFKQKAFTRRRYKQIKQNLNSLAHIKTQGASIDLFMPPIFAQKWARPHFLFRRMAYAASNNTVRNMKSAYDEGGYIHLVKRMTKYGLATGLTGYALTGIYEELLGRALPKENSPKWVWLMNMLHGGEFLGLASESFNMKEDSFGSRLWNMFAPTTGMLALNSLKLAEAYGQGKLNETQALDDFLRQSIAIYRAGNNVLEKGLLGDKLYKKDRRFDQLFSDYTSDVSAQDGLIEDIDYYNRLTDMSPYYRDLRTAFYSNNPKKTAKRILALTYALQDKYIKQGWYELGPSGQGIVRSPREALKQAHSQVKRYLTALNPNKLSKHVKKGPISRRLKFDFLKWLQKSGDKEYTRSVIKEMQESEKIYQERLVKVFKELNKAYKENYSNAMR